MCHKITYHVTFRRICGGSNLHIIRLQAGREDNNSNMKLKIYGEFENQAGTYFGVPAKRESAKFHRTYLHAGRHGQLRDLEKSS